MPSIALQMTIIQHPLTEPRILTTDRPHPRRTPSPSPSAVGAASPRTARNSASTSKPRSPTAPPIFQSDTAVYILAQKYEPVLEIALSIDSPSAARLGWMIGNLHFAIEVAGPIVRVIGRPRRPPALRTRAHPLHPVQTRLPPPQRRPPPLNDGGGTTRLNKCLGWCILKERDRRHSMRQRIFSCGLAAIAATWLTQSLYAGGGGGVGGSFGNGTTGASVSVSGGHAGGGSSFHSGAMAHSSSSSAGGHYAHTASFATHSAVGAGYCFAGAPRKCCSGAGDWTRNCGCFNGEHQPCIRISANE